MSINEICFLDYQRTHYSTEIIYIFIMDDDERDEFLIRHFNLIRINHKLSNELPDVVISTLKPDVVQSFKSKKPEEGINHQVTHRFI